MGRGREQTLEDEDLEDEIFIEEELPNFSEKNCCWTWSWCIAPIIKLILWSFQNYTAVTTAYGYYTVSQTNHSQINQDQLLVDLNIK
jgi:hypothetical protein